VFGLKPDASSPPSTGKHTPFTNSPPVNRQVNSRGSRCLQARRTGGPSESSQDLVPSALFAKPIARRKPLTSDSSTR